MNLWLITAAQSEERDGGEWLIGANTENMPTLSNVAIQHNVG